MCVEIKVGKNLYFTAALSGARCSIFWGRSFKRRDAALRWNKVETLTLVRLCGEAR